jgi:hypothetical protein
MPRLVFLSWATKSSYEGGHLQVGQVSLPPHLVAAVDKESLLQIGGIDRHYLFEYAAYYGLCSLTQSLIGSATQNQLNKALPTAAMNGHAAVFRIIEPFIPVVNYVELSLLHAVEYGFIATARLALKRMQAEEGPYLGNLLSNAIQDAALARRKDILNLLDAFSPRYAPAVRRALLAAVKRGDAECVHILLNGRTIVASDVDQLNIAIKAGYAGVVREYLLLMVSAPKLAEVLLGRKLSYELVSIITEYFGHALLPALPSVRSSMELAQRRGHTDVLQLLADYGVQLPPRSPPSNSPEDTWRAQVEYTAARVVRSIYAEMPGASLRRQVTAFAQNAFSLGRGVCFCMLVQHHLQNTQVDYIVHLTSTELKYCEAGSEELAGIPLTKWRLVNYNSFEVQAAFTNSHSGDTGVFWTFFDSCCRAMDDSLAPDNFIRSRQANGRLSIVDEVDFISGAALYGPVITYIDCHQFGPDWAPAPWVWLNGQTYDINLPQLDLDTGLRIGGAHGILSLLHDWLVERDIPLMYPPLAVDPDDEDSVDND